MGMLPCPVTCLVISLSDRAVRSDVCINERYIAVICLRLFIEKIEDPLGTCACHNDRIHLHRELVDIAHELLASVKERNDDIDAHRQSGEREIDNVQSCHDAACHSEENIDDVSDIVDDRS